MQITNNKLKEILETLKDHKYEENIDLINDVLPTFIEVDGCILIRNNKELNKSLNMEFILKQFGDRTVFEAVDSHLHMIDVSKAFVANPFEGLRFAMQLVKIWSRRLKEEFPQYRFLIILSFHGDDTIIRFHRLRQDERPWIDIGQIEVFGDEGIMIEVV